MSNQKIVTQLVSLMCLLRERAKALPTSRTFSVIQMQALYYVFKKDSCLMRDIASYLAITPPSATTLVYNLMKRGLLQRQVDVEDRRVVRLRVTTAGKRLLKQRFTEFSKAMGKALSGLTLSEKKQLITFLDSILVNG